MKHISENDNITKDELSIYPGKKTEKSIPQIELEAIANI